MALIGIRKDYSKSEGQDHVLRLFVGANGGCESSLLEVRLNL